MSDAKKTAAWLREQIANGYDVTETYLRGIAITLEQSADELEYLQAEVEGLRDGLQRIATKRHSYKHQAHNCDHRAALDSCIDIAKNTLSAAQEDKT